MIPSKLADVLEGPILVYCGKSTAPWWRPARVCLHIRFPSKQFQCPMWIIPLSISSIHFFKDKRKNHQKYHQLGIIEYVHNKRVGLAQCKSSFAHHLSHWGSFNQHRPSTKERNFNPAHLATCKYIVWKVCLSNLPTRNNTVNIISLKQPTLTFKNQDPNISNPNPCSRPSLDILVIVISGLLMALVGAAGSLCSPSQAAEGTKDVLLSCQILRVTKRMGLRIFNIPSLSPRVGHNFQETVNAKRDSAMRNLICTDFIANELQNLQSILVDYISISDMFESLLYWWAI